MSVKGAKAMTWDWDFLQGVPETEQCYNLTLRQIVFLMTVFQQSYWSTRWFNKPDEFEDIQAWVADVQTALLSPMNCNGVSPPIPVPEKIIEYVGGLIEIETEEDDMSRLTRVNINGVPYLADDCGCGNVEYFKLQAVQVNPDTGEIGTSIDQIPNETLAVDPGSAESCYWNAAAGVIISQIEKFCDGLFAYFQTASLNAFIGAGVESAQIINAILSGNAQLDFTALGYTVEEVKAALTSQGYRAYVAQKLQERGLSGQLTRWNVARLTQLEVPQSLNIPTPVTPQINYWGLFCNLQELNNLLSVVATQCRTGINPVQGDGWEIDLTQYGSKEELPFIFNQSGGIDLGTLVPFTGIHGVNVSQWQVYVSWEMPADLQIVQVGYRVSEGAMGGNPFLRSICNYNNTGCAGGAVNVSGFNEQNVSSASVTTDGAGLYFNALTGGDIVFDRFRILFDEPVTMPVGWTPYQFV